jgi:predicted MFS family arabinose efflux permease
MTDSQLSVGAPARLDDGDSSGPLRRTLRGLDWLNFFLADIQAGVGPFLAIYLAGYGWNAERIGLTLTVGGIATIVTQTPLGALVDHARRKRALLGIGVVVLVLGALCIACWPEFWPVMLGQVIIGGISSLFIPLVCAISLGIVGRRAFDARQGRNQTFNSAGNVVAALSMGAIGYFVSNHAIFVFMIGLAVPTLVALRAIRPEHIDHDAARGTASGAAHSPGRFRDLLTSKPLLVFLISAVLFHFANAAMLPILGERLAAGNRRASMPLMSACVITTQLVVVLLSSWSGRKATAWGRKPLLLVAFGLLPLRGFLYTLTDEPALLVAIQTLDGVCAGIFGVVSVLVIADLTHGTGRFNLALGAINTAVSIGAASSQLLAGSIAHRFGFRACFLFLALVALVGCAVLAAAMPETRRTEANGADG